MIHYLLELLFLNNLEKRLQNCKSKEEMDHFLKRNFDELELNAIQNQLLEVNILVLTKLKNLLKLKLV